MEYKEKTKIALDQLIERITAEVHEGKKNGELYPFKQDFFHWELNDFEYSKEGPKSSSGAGKYTTRDNWLKAADVLRKKVKSTSEFLSMAQAINLDYPQIEQPQDATERFIIRVGDILLENTFDHKERLNELIKRLLRDLNKQPYQYQIKVLLEGIILEIEQVELSVGVILRQTRIEDIEIPLPVDNLITSSNNFIKYPSAILDLEISSTSVEAQEFQSPIETYINILRLYKVGSVHYISYTFSSDAIIPMSYKGSIVSGIRNIPDNKYSLTKDNIDSLLDYWKQMTTILQRNNFELAKQSSFLAISFQRYTEAVLEQTVFERRITNVAMGLEAIYSNENHELSYKLRQRVAKALSLLNYEPLHVVSTVKEAYSIRSSFSHGSQLTDKELKRLTTKHGSKELLLNKVLDYLRTSIVTMIISEIQKEKLITLLDESMVEEKKELELAAIFTTVKSLVTNPSHVYNQI